MIVREATLKSCHFDLRVVSSAEPQFIDITDQVIDFVEQSQIQSGLAVVYSKHTTAAIVIQEKEPLLLLDLADTLERHAAKNAEYKHNDFNIRSVNMRPNEPPNGHAHCQHIVLGSSETIPIHDSKLCLGRYQCIFMIELDARSHSPHRDVLVQIMGV